MIVTLEVLTDIYSKPNKEGLQKLIKKNVISKKQFDAGAILVEQFLSPTGIASKKYCMIRHGEDYFKLNHKFEEIEKLTKPMVFKGYKINGYKNTKKI